MPIEVACTCGRTSRVKEEHAGKRAKCPACGNIVTVPNVEIDPEGDAARLIPESDEPPPKSVSPPRKQGMPAPPDANEDEEPKPYSLEQEPPKPKAAEWPSRKGKKRNIEYRARESSDRPVGISISPGVMGAIGTILIGGIWLAIRLADNRIPIVAVILIGMGVIGLIKGLLGYEEE